MSRLILENNLLVNNKEMNITINKQENILNNVVLNELVDMKRLNTLLNIKNKDLLHNEKKPEIEYRKLLQSYRKKCKKNVVKTKYNRKIKVARVYPMKYLSNGVMWKKIRHFLCSEKYIDIDMVNSHPVVLNQICLHTGIQCDNLTYYIDNRKTIIKEMMKLYNLDRDSIKEVFITTINGGLVSSWMKKHKLTKEYKFLNQYELELKKIRNIVIMSNSEFIKNLPKEKRNQEKSIMAYYLQEWECRILECVYKFLNDHNYIIDNFCTLCFDGILLLKNKKLNDDINDVLLQITRIVKQSLGFDVEFKVKEMNEGFDIEVEDVEDEDKTDNQKLYEYILKVSNENNYKKNKTNILKPSINSPIVYENYLSFEDFINETFNKDCIYYNLLRKNPSYFQNLIKYLETYNDVELPFINLNKYIFSFKNGYLDITDLYDLKFIDYSDCIISNDNITSIHYDFDFDVELLNCNIEDLKTPLFDKICNYHFKDDEILSIFYGMLGRLHYNTNKYDKFNCMAFIKGGANTGKSTTGNICMRNHQKIGTISGKMEQTFGLQSLINKNIIYNPDMNKNFVDKLDKGDFQRIIEGSNIDIPVKNKASINNYKWETPLLFLGNYLPIYKDSSGAIPRRLCVFYMDQYINERDTTLEKRCIENEGHLILLKTLLSYKLLIEKYEKKTFEDWDLDYFKEGYEEMTNQCNNLYKYLNLAPDDFETWTSQDMGNVVTEKEFKKVVMKYYYMNGIKDKFECNKTTLGKFGYIIKTIQICASCGKKPTGSRNKDNRCCEKYTNKNRRKKKCIINMKIHCKDQMISDYEN
tara:strand:+ start:152 stop:2584 length:2433 start_codon:yes stop_codon:yes gene_type:complete